MPRENANDELAEDAPEPQRELLASGAATDAKKTTVDGVCYAHPDSEDESRDQRRNPTPSLMSGYVGHADACVAVSNTAAKRAPVSTTPHGAAWSQSHGGISRNLTLVGAGCVLPHS